MTRLSVIIITNNEEKNLRRCLESVRFADEIIVNDSGSTDATVEIARSMGCQVFCTKFSGFGAAKQAALEKASGDWVLSIDADEVIDDELRKSIESAISGNGVGAYWINRKSQFLGSWIMHSGWYPDYVIRLFRRDKAHFSDDLVHEQVVSDCDSARLAGHMLHYTDPDISHHLRKLDRYTTLSAQILADRGKSFHWWHLIVKPIAIWVKMFILKGGFLDGMAGFVLAGLSAYHVYVKYAKLWEIRKS